jgi:phosphoribosylformylglycinamidine cyclo-ligase
VVVADPARADALAGLLRDAGETVFHLGTVTPGDGVTYTGTLG